MAQTETLDPKINECVKRCIETFSICVKTMSYCLELGGEHAEKEHISLLDICADVCQVSARAMLMGSNIYRDICLACASTCYACAESCDTIPDERMQRCAAACRQCAEVCGQMKIINKVNDATMIIKGQGPEIPPTI